MKITLNGIPPSLNTTAGRGNVWEYRKNKTMWTQAVYMKCKASKERPAKPFEKARVTITYFFGDRRRHDADNYAGKYLLDGLTKAGVIVDDDLKHITTTIVGEYDKQHPRTEITVEEVVTT
jgi:Holliday junction resolvase RusA-like endonuclease